MVGGRQPGDRLGQVVGPRAHRTRVDGRDDDSVGVFILLFLSLLSVSKKEKHRPRRVKARERYDLTVDDGFERVVFIVRRWRRGVRVLGTSSGRRSVRCYRLVSYRVSA